MINTNNVKLLGALQTIKEECFTHISCIDCPLCAEGLTANNMLKYAEYCSLKRELNPSTWILRYKEINKMKGALIKDHAKD